MSAEIDRRHFALMSVLGLGTGLGACAAGEPESAEVSTQDRIRAAEELLGVSYTDAERAMMVESLEERRETLQALRRFDKPNALAPATVFDPRLSGRDYALRAATRDVFYGGDSAEETAEGAAFQARLEALGIDGDVPTPFDTLDLGTPQIDPGPRPLPDSSDLAYASVGELARLMRRDGLTSERLTQIYLDRIERYAPELECFVTVTPELALEQAREADRRRAAGERGALLGIPYAAKDLFDTAGVATTFGAEPFRDRVPDTDAWVVERLRAAGAVLLGKTTLGALAYGDIWFGGRTNNPWNPREGSSGSSAGSASAVAAGLCAFALGTETLGSLVSPSTRCGTASLRPTFGVVPRTGAMALVWSMDKIGPIVRHMGDAELIMPVLTGTDAQDAGSLGTVWPPRAPKARLRVGYDPAWFADADSGQRAALDALRELADVVEVADVVPTDLPLGSLSYILVSEAAAAFEALTLDGRDDSLSWQDAAAWPNTFRAARFVSAIDLVQASRVRRLAMERMAETFAEVDALVGPPFAGGLLQVTNYTGHPCVVLRSGFSEQPTRTLFGDADVEAGSKRVRVPNSICLWGGLFRDADLVWLGARLSAALGVANERPTGFGKL